MEYGQLLQNLGNCSTNLLVSQYHDAQTARHTYHTHTRFKYTSARRPQRENFLIPLQKSCGMRLLGKHLPAKTVTRWSCTKPSNGVVIWYTTSNTPENYILDAKVTQTTSCCNQNLVTPPRCAVHVAYQFIPCSSACPHMPCARILHKYSNLNSPPLSELLWQA